jgi:hypothetical protein
MPYRLRRHPVPMRTRFGHSLVLMFAYPPGTLAPMLPPGLVPDVYRDPAGTEHAFVAVGIVTARELRPAGLPAALGRDAVLTGYRIVSRFRPPGGRVMRGLYVLRSDTDRRLLALGGNLLTRYHYRLAEIRMRTAGGRLAATVDSHDGRADLTVTADLASTPDGPPAGSPFADLAAARRFAGPLPYTFDHEPATGSIVVVKAYRGAWRPEPVAAEVGRATFLDQPAFGGGPPRLANAFHVSDVDYGWHRGRAHRVDGGVR